MRSLYLYSTGGLGNQLFIYNVAHLQHDLRKQRVVILFSINTKSRTDRPIELEKLIKNCEHNIEIRNFGYFNILFAFLARLSKILFLVRFDLLKCLKIQIFDSPFEESNKIKIDSRLVMGYFQTYEDVAQGWSLYSNEFIKLLSDVGLKLKDFRLEKHRIGVHFRRGDTLNFSHRHGILSYMYYEKCLDLIRNVDGDYPVYICFDDPEFSIRLKERFSNSTLLGPKEFDAWDSLAFLSGSTHLIMANSTLSWWAAYIKRETSNANIYFPLPWNRIQITPEKSVLIPDCNVVVSIFEDE